MLLKITFLGTSGTIPSVERNPSAVFVRHGSHRILFDCGEGTQRQMMIAKTGFKLDAIFITHLHTDHFIGLFGLLETMSLNERREKLAIYSPNARFLASLFKAFGYDELSYPIEVVELRDGDEVKFDGFKVVAFKTDHIVPSLGYALIEKDRPGKFYREKAEALGIPPGPLYAKLVKGESVVVGGKVITPEMVVGKPRPGRKIVYTGDTRPCERTIEIARSADVLIHDAAFTSDLQEWAEETKHSTAREAAEVAKAAGVKKLVLTHVSARYSKDATPLLEEARAVFENAMVAEDFMAFEVRYKD
ncbi:ribonuclease Z [Archaeoglobus veneficus]|uniref:Ribonuclease Z n=1 Tax=Archaeoglobus veneficus (strain DSM 11195 / SNP6) TaxID=693661 RepID=F2KT49_ARCVS|nr:ribonuclease Z [Archaeoglobus veneficus]AEA47079.1 Ribonuclease Z [Archaeoglobus veneficus SNP6]